MRLIVKQKDMPISTEDTKQQQYQPLVEQHITEHLLTEHAVPDTLPAEHAAWVDLAPQVEAWHPDLQEHYHANMARLGITHLMSKETQSPEPSGIEHDVPTLEDAQTLVAALQQGESIDVSVAEELIVWGYGQEVICNFDLVSGDTSRLALDLLKTEGVESIMEHLESMHGLDGTFSLTLLTQLRENPHSDLTKIL